MDQLNSSFSQHLQANLINILFAILRHTALHTGSTVRAGIWAVYNGLDATPLSMNGSQHDDIQPMIKYHYAYYCCYAVCRGDTSLCDKGWGGGSICCASMVRLCMMGGSARSEQADLPGQTFKKCSQNV
jgi:hypothetical protein